MPPPVRHLYPFVQVVAGKKKFSFLIAEDELTSRALLQIMLSPFGQCRVARDGREAVALFADSLADGAEPYALVCLDIEMPGLDGQQVLQEIRRLERQHGRTDTAMARVVMVTALADSRNITEAMVVGRCQGYLRKPVDPFLLHELLRQFCLLDEGDDR